MDICPKQVPCFGNYKELSIFGSTTDWLVHVANGDHLPDAHCMDSPLACRVSANGTLVALRRRKWFEGADGLAGPGSRSSLALRLPQDAFCGDGGDRRGSDFTRDRARRRSGRGLKSIVSPALTDSISCGHLRQSEGERACDR